MIKARNREHVANTIIQRWVTQFRNDAEADHYAIFRSHLCRLGLPDEPEMLLAGTVDVVIAAVAYANLDNQLIDAFLKLQRYDPAKAAEAKYAFTFDLFSRAFGRVLVPTKAVIPDLADLFEHPWEDYQVCGYSSIRISRTDNKNLSARELARLEKEVTSDLRFDYTEDELDLWFDDQSIKGILLVSVQEK